MWIDHEQLLTSNLKCDYRTRILMRGLRLVIPMCCGFDCDLCCDQNVILNDYIHPRVAGIRCLASRLYMGGALRPSLFVPSSSAPDL